MITDRRLQGLAVSAAFGLTLVVTWLIYRPGLRGGFVFDDFANLPVLGYYGRVDNWKAFWLYLTSGSADPTGRPLALLSFLLDANTWPADPYRFKRTGVLLHLLNGALLTWLLFKLGRATGRADANAALAAVLGAALWLLHPLMLSTTLYVIQRETVLAATFVLIGLLGHAAGRELAARNRLSGVWLATLSISVCTPLALLCKANGVLLPLLVLLLETVLLSPVLPVTGARTRRAFAIYRFALLVVPSVALAIFLGWEAYKGFVEGMPPTRPWTLGERLLTEARIVIGYFVLLWLPRAFSPGLFNDNVSASSGLFSPPETLICVLAIVFLAAGAWRFRGRRPVLAGAILFFLAGHLLESTVIPLELYFEHRNYLPAVLLFWPLALWISEPRKALHGSVGVRLRHLRLALAIFLPLMLSLLTLLGAELWGDVRDQALVWAMRNPHSPRAQVTAAQIERARGENAAALVRLRRALDEKPNELQIVLNLLGAQCDAGAITGADVERAAYALRTTPTPGRLGGDWFIHSLEIAKEGSCPGLTLDVLDRLLEASAENPRAKDIPARFLQDRLHIQARIALLRNHDERALALFDAALVAEPQPAVALEQAAIMGAGKKPLLALRHLDFFAQHWTPPAGPGWTMMSLHAWLLSRTGYWDHEIVHMRNTLATDVAAGNSNAK